MKRIILTLALGTALSSAAFAQSVGEKTGVNSALGIAPKTEDFVKEAAMSDMLEIESAKIAQQKGNAEDKKVRSNDGDRSYEDEHRAEGNGASGPEAALPAALDDASQKKLGKLRDAKPDDFAGEYEPMQVSAHKEAVSLFERYANGGDNAKLKDWARRTLPALKHHLEMAQNLDKIASNSPANYARR